MLSVKRIAIAIAAAFATYLACRYILKKGRKMFQFQKGNNRQDYSPR
ncbi:MAG TPA: hypothetical protein VE130_00065 [Nitrososphaeraceae archaeon]|nr:hypothetical protein [Nitrososphaeraceae archaeon]